MKRRWKYLFAFSLFLIVSALCNAQESGNSAYTLKQAQDYALSNSYKTKDAQIDLELTKKNRQKFISFGLPQVFASGKYTYYIDLPTQLMPDFLSPAVDGVLLQHGLITPSEMLPVGSDKFEVQFGSPHNLAGDVTISQLLFDGTFVVGLKAAKLLIDISQKSCIRTEIEVKESVAQAYYLILIANENRTVLDSTLVNLNRLLFQTEQIQINGFMEETDVEQLQLIISNLKNKIAMVDRQIILANDLLKFQMGIDLDEKITLSDDLADLINQAIGANLSEKKFNSGEHIDYQLMQEKESLLRQVVRVDKMKYLPSLNLFLNTSYSAQRSQFNFFKGGDENKWFKTTVVGLNLSIPIWSSGMRKYQIQQDKLNVTKQENVVAQVEQGLRMEVENARADLKTFTDQYRSEIGNMDLAKRIYEKNMIKYKEGPGSSMELNQAYNQYLQTQGNYFLSMLQMLNAFSKLNKALNNY